MVAMFSKQRYRSGESAPVTAVRQGGTGLVFSIGDLVVVSGAYILPASQITTLAAMQTAFLGVLVQGADDGSAKVDTNVLVETLGEFEYDLAAAASVASPVGSLVEPVLSGGFVANQVVAIGTDATTAIGQLARPCKIGDTTVLVRIVTRIMAPSAIT